MCDITVIILTKNEEKNIEKCIASTKDVAKRVLVIDCGSTDKTVDLATQSGAEVYFNEWCGHANQFNWALDNCDINTEWIFRLDADERFSDELAIEIKKVLDNPESQKVDGYMMRYRLFFMGKWIKHGGTHNAYLLRLFRCGKGHVENRLMDEHIIVNGKTEKLQSDLIHYDYKGLDVWLNKHVWYSQLELKVYHDNFNETAQNETQKKKRGFYYKLPLFLRARFYFWYRYYLQFGFLDGKEGRIFLYLQAYWYRFVIDAQIYEQEKQGNKKDEVSE